MKNVYIILNFYTNFRVILKNNQMNFLYKFEVLYKHQGGFVLYLSIIHQNSAIMT